MIVPADVGDAACALVPIGCEVLGGAASAAGTAAESAAGSIVNTVFSRIVSGLQHAVSWLGQQIAELLNTAGKPDWSLKGVFTGNGPTTGSVMIWLGLVMVGFTGIFRIVSYVRTQNASAGEAIADIPATAMAVVGCWLICGMILNFTDALGDWIMPQATQAGTLAALTPSVGNVVIGLLFSVLMILGLLMLFLEQLVRAFLLQLSVLFLPIGIGLYPWQGARYVTQTMVKFFLALAIMPIVLACALQVASGNWSVGTTDLIKAFQGTAGLAVTVFMPMAILKLVPVNGGGGGGGGGGGYAMAAMGGAMEFGSAMRELTSMSASSTESDSSESRSDMSESQSDSQTSTSSTDSTTMSMSGGAGAAAGGGGSGGGAATAAGGGAAGAAGGPVTMVAQAAVGMAETAASASAGEGAAS